MSSLAGSLRKAQVIPEVHGPFQSEQWPQHAIGQSVGKANVALSLDHSHCRVWASVLNAQKHCDKQRLHQLDFLQ